MAVVMELVTAYGVKVRVHDDCYRDLTEAQLAERDRELAAAIQRIDAQLRRKAERERAPDRREG